MLSINHSFHYNARLAAFWVDMLHSDVQCKAADFVCSVRCIK